MTRLSMEEVVRGIRDLPSLPSIVLELLAAMDQDNASIGFLAERISQDQALTAKTLRLANSSFYGMPAAVTTVQQAIAILGLGTVRMLVAAASIKQTFNQETNAGFNFKQFWQYAIATAICAKSLAPGMGIAPGMAFITGLLHDVGQLVLAMQFPILYTAVLAQVAADDCALLDAERAVMGIDHARVGGALAAHWSFPQMMHDAVEGHHADHGAGAAELVLVVQLADALAHALDLTGNPREAVPVLPDAVWAHLPQDPQKLQRMTRDIVAEYQSICQILVG